MTGALSSLVLLGQWLAPESALQGIALFGAAAGRVNDFWYALPLIVVISLVYSATRNESNDLILFGAARIGAWISGFMLIVFAVLLLLSSLV